MSQREHGLQTNWFLKLIALLTAPGKIYPRKPSAYGLNKDRSGRDLDQTKMLSTYANVEKMNRTNAASIAVISLLSLVFTRLLANRKTSGNAQHYRVEVIPKEILMYALCSAARIVTVSHRATYTRARHTGKTWSKTVRNTKKRKCAARTFDCLESMLR